jgi:predicted phosphodiesterase
VKIHPELFHAYFKIEQLLEWLVFGLKNKKFQGLTGSLLGSAKHLQIAREILSKGFDIVIFGHSHQHGLHVLEDGKIYANAGAWTSRRSHFLEILNCSISLKEWR